MPENNNMKYWEKVSEVPKNMLREIKAGRLKGKSDINPAWRMEAMTSVLGPCGLGWKYTVDKIWTDPGPEGSVMVFVQISLCIACNERWSAPIPGIGGSHLISKEKSGLHGNDEGYKMALTDALSVAMKAIGVGAKVYQGLWDGSKYNIVPPSPGNPSSATTTADKTDSPAALELADKLVVLYGEDSTYQELQKRGKDPGNLAIIKGFSESLCTKVRAAFSARLKVINAKDEKEGVSFLDSALNEKQLVEFREAMQSAAAKYSPKVQEALEAHFVKLKGQGQGKGQEQGQEGDGLPF